MADTINLQKMQHYMALAYELAEKGLGMTSPNPMVGALVIKNDAIIGRGHHQKSGLPHAEVMAILDAKNHGHEVAGATLVSTLEPCCHRNKKTPPCTDFIIKNKIVTVIFSQFDPNPDVSGKGAMALKNSGIKIHSKILTARGDKLNKIYLYNKKHLMPYVHLKMAQTLDGKIATKTGNSRWISGETPRTWAHQQRFNYDAVLIGRKTLNADNPLLNIRMGIDNKGKIPFRIILGNPEKFDWQAQILCGPETAKTIIITNQKIISEKIKKTIIQQKIILITGELKDCLSKIYQEYGITSLFVEGGSGVFSSFLNEKLYQELTLFIAPIILGEGEAIYKGPLLDKIEQAISLKDGHFFTMGKQMAFHHQRPF